MLLLIALPIICAIGIWLFVNGKSKARRMIGTFMIVATLSVAVLVGLGIQTQTIYHHDNGTISSS